MHYLFKTLIPVPWLLIDILTLAISLMVMTFIMRRSRFPVIVLLECVAFIFLYAGVFENLAVANGSHVYGRSYLMVGDIPLSVLLIEMDVFFAGLWLLQKMEIPVWCKPFIVGFFGMLQDFSLDVVAIRQIYAVEGVTTGRWSWLISPEWVNIHAVPVYNFSGWMLIMMWAAVYILLGRWWFKRSGYKPAVGYVYPFIACVLALISLVSPLANLLLWLEPFMDKGSYSEWIMLGFHCIFPCLLLLFFWRGRMKSALTLRGDSPVFAVVIGFHWLDIVVAITSGFDDVLGFVVLSSAVHITLLGFIYYCGSKVINQAQQAAHGSTGL